ncbi:MAG: DUF1549 domain-containing protein, partial [Pirellula sp.]
LQQPSPGNDESERIDALIQSAYDKASIQPAEICSDPQFVRRVYIDLAGRIPTLDERQTFLDDPRHSKRTELIDKLLQSEDYVQNFADTFDTLLMGRAPNGKIAERKKLW